MESSLMLNTGMGMSMAHARGETAVAGHGGDQNIRIPHHQHLRCYTTGWDNRACRDLKTSKKFPQNPWSYSACGSSRSVS